MTKEGITITDSKLKFVLSVVAIVGVAWSVSSYVLDKEHRLIAVENLITSMIVAQEKTNEQLSRLREQQRNDTGRITSDIARLDALLSNHRGQHNEAPR